MTNTKRILSIAAMSCLLLCLPVRAQEPGAADPDLRTQLAEAEFDVSMHELELKMSELSMDEAVMESAKVELQLKAAQVQQDSHQVGHVKLELKQAAIRVEMRKVELLMVRLQLEQAKVRLAHLRTAAAEQPEEPSPVKVEYVDNLDVLILRGEKKNVQRIKALIEGAEKKESVE